MLLRSSAAHAAAALSVLALAACAFVPRAALLRALSAGVPNASRAVRIACAALPALVVAWVVASGFLSAGQPGTTAALPGSPAPASFVVDGGPVLSPAARAALEARIRTVQQTTGGDVAVAVVPDLGGRAPSDAGLALYRAWKVGAVDRIGSPYRDLGALLLVVPKELAPDGRGECWITTGLGAEGTLTDARAARICREGVIPHLKRRDHAAALAAGVDSIAAAFAEEVAGADSATAADIEEAPAGVLARAEQHAARADASACEGAGAVDTSAAAPDGGAHGAADSAAADSACGCAGSTGTVADAAADSVEMSDGAEALVADADGTEPGGARPLGLALLAAGVLTGGCAGARHVRRHRPRDCPHGHGPMTRLHELADDAALTPAQQAEEKLRSVDYDVWACRRCDARAVVPHRPLWTRYHDCAGCGGRAATRAARTLRAPTTASTGTEELTFTCLHCGRVRVEHRTIHRRSSSSSSGSRSGASSSFGGSGRSSGGGGGSSY